MTIAPGATLTIDAGVTVLVDNNRRISVPPGAGLVTTGTAALPHPLVTLSWRLDLHDGGDPGTTDTLRLRLSDGYDSGTLARVTGNLKVH